MIIKNFLFHRVSDETDHLWPPMPVALFRSLIRHITNEYTVVNLEEYLGTEGVKSTAKKPATILFDDGYKDNIEYAVAILDQYKCPASFYVTTSCIDENIPTWTYIVDYLFQHTKATRLRLDMKEAQNMPAPLREAELKTHAERINTGKLLKPWMKTLSNTFRQEVLQQLQTNFSDVELPRNKMMNWEDLSEMQAAGFTIGSHSWSHPLLATIMDEKELLFELEASGRRIESKLGKFPDTISYPVGSYDQRVIHSAKKAGYKIGLAVKQRFYDTGKDDKFAIPRVELYNEPMWKCRLRISGIYGWVKQKMGSS